MIQYLDKIFDFNELGLYSNESYLNLNKINKHFLKFKLKNHKFS